jgi:cell division protein FtsZ
MDILTVGIVTMPFQFEGRMRTQQAQKGVDELRQNVDSLIVINNNKLREVYGNLGFKAGFSKADEVLSTASRGIAEVITHHYKQNIDLHDAKTVLSNSGTAIMGSAKEAGSNRAKNAIVKALDSPLLNDNKITGAKNVLLLIISGQTEVTIDEIGEINDYIQTEAGFDANIIMGVGEDESLEDEISLTVVATGFAPDQQGPISDTEVKKVIHTLEDEQKAIYSFQEKNSLKDQILSRQSDAPFTEKKVVFELGEEEEVPNNIVGTTNFIQNLDVQFEEIDLGKTIHELEDVSSDNFEITDVSNGRSEEVLEEAPVQMDLLFDLPVMDAEMIDANNTNSVCFNVEHSVEEFINGIEVVDHEEVNLVSLEKQKDESVVRFTLEDELDKKIVDINEIEVDSHVEIKAKEEGTIRYSLEDFDIQPTIKNASTFDINNIKLEKPEVIHKEEEIVDEALKITIKEKKVIVDELEVFEAKEVSPFDATISEIQQTANSRREKMKKFNYKFNNNVPQNIDDIEKVPAYKRNGVDLEETNTFDTSQSRTSLSVDDNDKIQLRSNNSFLHDNVD